MGKFVDLTGEKFGRLLVLSRVENKDGYVRYLCKCDCGNTIITRGTRLKSGGVKSCGCLQKEHTSRLGVSKRRYDKSLNRLRRIYQAMINRCYNPNQISFHNYGGRGIKVCLSWKSNRNLFFEWALNNGYKENLTIDRIDNNGDYSPQNCKWTSLKEQARNRRSTALYFLNGETKPLAEWAEIYQIDYKLVFKRLKLGWSLQKALTKPSQKK